MTLMISGKRLVDSHKSMRQGTLSWIWQIIEAVQRSLFVCNMCYVSNSVCTLISCSGLLIHQI